MKLALVFLLALLATMSSAQNNLGLECTTEYQFQSATAWHKSVPVTHLSTFNFFMDSTHTLWYWENNDSPCSLGKPYFLKRYPSENGAETFLYQCKEVKVEYTQDGTQVIITISYGNKHIVFHQMGQETASAHKRNK